MVEDLNNQSLNELKGRYLELSREIYNMKTGFSVDKKLDKPHLMKKMKRDRARVMTVISRHKLESSSESMVVGK